MDSKLISGACGPRAVDSGVQAGVGGCGPNPIQSESESKSKSNCNTNPKRNADAAETSRKKAVKKGGVSAGETAADIATVGGAEGDVAGTAQRAPQVQAGDSPHPARLPNGRFVKGVSGNPRGRPKVPQDLRDQLRAAAPEAVRTLLEIMRDDAVKPELRRSCAELILERVLGKSAQPLDHRPQESGGSTVRFVLDEGVRDYAE